ncbi:MAG: ATP-binding protein [Eubacteriales bacterium]|nr:ATP-binding protein [Eubacteriales bacterium]
MTSKPNVATLYSSFASGSDVTLSLIEVSISPGIPTFSVIGLCDSSIRESEGRLRSAFKSAGFTMPKGHITVGISPAYMRKTGTGFDLALAMGILFASGQLYLPTGAKIYVEGELSLGGEVKLTPGSCIRLKTVRDMDFDYKIIPQSESSSAAIAGFNGQGINSLTELNAIFDGNEYKESSFEFETESSADDFLDISLLKGQEKTKRALLISAAGFHNIILLGSPGSGKTMAGKIMTGLLPRLSRDELSDVYSLYELVDGESSKITFDRPVRMIGPNTTVGRLLGNTRSVTPGELALANKGIMFADELPLYKTEVLDFLRVPLEERKVHMAKKGVLYSFDSDFIFLGTGNPCKCGQLYEKGSKCRCTVNEINRYLSKLNGPFMERIDIVSEMRSISGNDMASIYTDAPGLESLEYRQIVERCWQKQHKRYGGLYLNANFPDADIKDAMRIPDVVVKYASDLSEKGFFSARGFTRILRVARTIADIKNADDVTVEDVSEAAQFRKRGS